MKTLFIECNMGAAGDMLTGALYELCEQKELFLNMMHEVFSPLGVSIETEKIVKCGICGTKVRVFIDQIEEIPASENADQTEDNSLFIHGQESDDTHTHEHRSYPELLEKISSFALPEQVKEDVSSIYRLIGEAESAVHGVPLEQIHFHEIGSLDALADVTGCALLMYLLVPDHVICTPIHVGNGFVKCAHGILSVPAPATAELLKGIPFYTGAFAGELLTPTGAAILKYYVNSFANMPSIKVEAIGYGMGTKDFEAANCVRMFFGEEIVEEEIAPLSKDTEQTADSASITTESEQKAGPKEEPFGHFDKVLEISCNLDDMTGEAVGLATEILMAAGALDVYTIPIQMKKNRPGILLTCFCEIEDRDKFTGLLFLHTTTRGIRYQEYERAKLESTFESHASPYGSIRVKKSTGYGVEKEKPEFEDLKTIVLKNGCSIEEIKRNIT